MKRPPKIETFKILKRVFGELRRAYPVMFPVAVLLIALSAAGAAVPDVFIQRVLSIISKWVDTGDWAGARGEMIPNIILLVILYLIGLLCVFAYTRMMATITQGFLSKMRQKMFNGMQDLPLSFFDRNKTGDIMSHYTNDIDTLRQLVSQAFPSMLRAGLVVLVVFFVMLFYSIWITLIVVVGVIAMVIVSKKMAGRSARYFIKTQISTGRLEGYIQEMMNGQKVVKVFNHEEEVKKGFDELNDALREDVKTANTYANVLPPVIGNIGNILYVAVAVIGGTMLINGVENISISGWPLTIAIVVTFLNMTKQFTGNVNSFSQQINAVVMGLAGSSRIFEMMDLEPESDEGTVTLVDAVTDDEGNIIEADHHTGQWAWKRPLEDGTFEYVPLKGDVRIYDMDFAYVPDKTVLKDITLYAKPGQKVAFVGATGAGKTTVTNLINRFYEVGEGKIFYDGIDINQIKKNDLRRSLGLVLQDTNLFTGTILENIRYGNLKAGDDECVEAAKLAGADDFITRLPDGYDTMLTNNGANLSQGQRQLIAIARAAVADPPVMMLDEATSSIDTHTEAIVQQGMDKLMEGRTVFVIAHRLSTVKNSNVIMVLDHGVIIERGTHESLLEEKGMYYQLYTGAFELE
ncbi:MAG: ABC transporter ATP-binding protein [Lachnospiraceae bacterium]|nr:ABC transporter ATP-binding protein [Lachnospiraceae bacterium]